jgi:PAS domain S-box-containing protein
LEDFLMADKPSYEELEQRLNKLEKETSEARQAERASKRTERQERAILDSLLEHVVYQDTDHRVLWANQGACNSAGMTREGLMGRHCYEVWAGRESPCEDCPVAKARDTGKRESLEKVTPDGRWWYIVGYPVRDDSGEIAGMTEVTLDITDRKRAQEMLQKSHDSLEGRVKERTAHLVETIEALQEETEKREVAQKDLVDRERLLSNVFDAIEDPVVLIDKDLRIVMSNWKYDNHLSEEMRGGHPYCYASLMNRKTPCEPCCSLEVFRTGKAAHFEQTNPLDGKIREIHAWPVLDDENNVIMLVEHLRDITERNRTEKALRDSEETLKAIMAAAPVGIGLAQDRIIQWSNRALYHMLGYDEGALDGIGTKMIYADRDEYERVGRDLYPVVEAEGIGHVETKWVAKDGAVLDCYVQLTALDRSDLSKGVIVAAMDITHRKQAEDQIRTLSHQLLQAQEVERQRLAYDLHDHLAQDLSALKIAFDTFCDCHPEISTGARQRMSGLSKGLGGVIGDVRDLAYALRPPGLDEAGLVDALDEYCQEYASKNDLKIEFSSVGVDESEVDLDTKITLYRLVQEALSNVTKHADASHVFIRLVPSSPNIILRIEDDGRGFDVAARLAAAHYEKRLGLLGMKERVALLGGTMEVQSRLEQGTRIFIELPCGVKYRDKEEDHANR